MYWKLKEFEKTIAETRDLIGEADESGWGQQPQQYGHFAGVGQKPQMIDPRGLSWGGLFKGLAHRGLQNKQIQQSAQQFPQYVARIQQTFGQLLNDFNEAEKAGKNIDPYVQQMRELYKDFSASWKQYYQRTGHYPNENGQPDAQKMNAAFQMFSNAPQEVTDPHAEKFFGRSRSDYYGRQSYRQQNAGKPGNQFSSGRSAGLDKSHSEEAEKALTSLMASTGAQGEKEAINRILDVIANDPELIKRVKDGLNPRPQSTQQPQPAQPASQQKIITPPF